MSMSSALIRVKTTAEHFAEIADTHRALPADAITSDVWCAHIGPEMRRAEGRGAHRPLPARAAREERLRGSIEPVHSGTRPFEAEAYS